MTNLKRTTRSYSQPAHEHDAKRGYKLRIAEELEASEEIDAYRRLKTEEPLTGRDSPGCEEVYHP